MNSSVMKRSASTRVTTPGTRHHIRWSSTLAVLPCLKMPCTAWPDGPLHLLTFGFSVSDTAAQWTRSPTKPKCRDARGPPPVDTTHVPVEALPVVAPVMHLTPPSFHTSWVAGYVTLFEGFPSSPPKHVRCVVSFEPRYDAGRTEPASKLLVIPRRRAVVQLQGMIHGCSAHSN